LITCLFQVSYVLFIAVYLTFLFVCCVLFIVVLLLNLDEVVMRLCIVNHSFYLGFLVERIRDIIGWITARTNYAIDKKEE
jgi:hypothetical protein